MYNCQIERRQGTFATMHSLMDTVAHVAKSLALLDLERLAVVGLWQRVMVSCNHRSPVMKLTNCWPMQRMVGRGGNRLVKAQPMERRRQIVEKWVPVG